jgi:ADP-ribose pyrophosphatase YjhB (NUDIX family)
VLIQADGHILLVQGWLGSGQWGLPGGGLHRHENPRLGAVREVAEETSVPLLPEQCAHIGNEWRSKNGLRWYCHFFATRLPNLIQPHPQPGEIIATRWVPLTELEHMPLLPEVSRALELLAEQP